MTLAVQSWLAKAQTLPLGTKRRVRHDCGEGLTMLISNESKGFTAYCFRCSDSGWHPPAREELGVRLARLSALSEADSIASLPTPPTPALPWPEWPAVARLWLLKAGLSASDAGKLGAFYHPPTQRVILPVKTDGEIVFWQGRALEGRIPKYLAPDVPKDKLVPQYGGYSSITLTEDLLSAYKVGTVAEGWCLMGTSLSPYCLALLLKRQAPVNVWLDDDAAGNRASKKIARTLRGVGLVVNRIITPKDPKLVPRGKIEELLCTI